MSSKVLSLASRLSGVSPIGARTARLPLKARSVRSCPGPVRAVGPHANEVDAAVVRCSRCMASAISLIVPLCRCPGWSPWFRPSEQADGASLGTVARLCAAGSARLRRCPSFAAHGRREDGGARSRTARPRPPFPIIVSPRPRARCGRARKLVCLPGVSKRSGAPPSIWVQIDCGIFQRRP